jgi:hypothetical protein
MGTADQTTQTVPCWTDRSGSYFTNLTILVPQVGQTARIMLRPLAVFSFVTLSSATVFFSLHLTQNISTISMRLPSIRLKSTPFRPHKSLCKQGRRGPMGDVFTFYLSLRFSSDSYNVRTRLTPEHSFYEVTDHQIVKWLLSISELVSHRRS